MDNKEVIKWLKYIKDMYSWSVNCDKSLDKAIESLEACEKYSQIVKLMDGVTMNPPPYCRPYKYTKKQKVYDTMYEIQRIIGEKRFDTIPKEDEEDERCVLRSTQ